ncbi:hypothetical protein ACWKWU_01355 [Chitinophaga lutea]
MEEKKQQKNIKALSATLAVHALLLVTLFMISFSAPPPLPDQDLGMEVNLGTSDEGTGDEQPMNPNPPAAAEPVPAAPSNPPAPAPSQAETQEYATQNEEEAPEVKNPPKPAPKPKEIPKTIEPKVEKVTKKPKAELPPTPAEPKRQPKAVFTGGTGPGPGGNSANGSNNATGEGNTGRTGDRGVLGGDPNATGYTGTPGAGRGASDFRLAGRNLLRKPNVSWDGNETGYVAVNIKVDREGNVVSATYSLRNSTINNPKAIQIAIEAAKRDLKYSVNPDAPEEQFGPIRFYFKAQ